MERLSVQTISEMSFQFTACIGEMPFSSSLEAVAVGDDFADDGEPVLLGEPLGHAPAQREARRPVVVRGAQLMT